MAKNENWMKKAGVTPGKLALIAVLAVVLGGVLYLQFRPTAKESAAPAQFAAASAESSSATETPNAPAAEASANDVTAPRKKTGTVTSWQSPELSSIVQYDPFALPASFPQPQHADEEVAMAQSAAQAEDATEQQAALEVERAKSEGELQGLRQQGVAVIIKKKKEYVAIVGAQEVHVGDQINGFTVIAIDADGVRVAKDLTP